MTIKLLRQKHLQRWQLMRNTISDNLAEHAFTVALIAIELALLRTDRLINGDELPKVSVEKVAMAALFHDAPEIITGDLPTPIKHGNKAIESAYAEIEKDAISRLTQGERFSSIYQMYMSQSELTSDEIAFVKAADKISAYIKCIEEKEMGNKDFSAAERSLEKVLSSLQTSIPEVGDFLRENNLSKTIDELFKSEVHI